MGIQTRQLIGFLLGTGPRPLAVYAGDVLTLGRDPQNIISLADVLATDFNPGSSPTPSMPMVLSLACTQMKMSPAEAIAAATINGACALRLQERKGTIEPGKDADLAVFDVADYREISYWFAADRCAFTVAAGHTEELE